LGKVVMHVTFGTCNNYRMKNTMFDIAEILLPYNGLLAGQLWRSSWWQPTMHTT
jgi:hypothetical protein